MTMNINWPCIFLPSFTLFPLPLMLKHYANLSVWSQRRIRNLLKNIKNALLFFLNNFSSVQFSHSVMSDSLWPHESQHARPPCPSPTPRVHPNPCPLSRWCHPTNLCHPLLLLPSVFPSIRVFSNESALHIRWPKYWSFSFSISPFNEHPGLISFRMDWLDLLRQNIY